MIEKMSESSVTPLWIGCQFAPPSLVFHARCHVPAYTTFGSFGSIAIDSMFLISAWFAGDMRRQLLPRSSERKTPSSAPITIVFSSDGATAIARMLLLCANGSAVHVFPPSLER